MFSREDHESEKARFWEKTEEELGERVLVYALTRCMSGCVEGDEKLWGMLFLTETGLFFRHFAQRNWFSALTSTVSGAGSEPKEVYFRIPRGDIHSAVMEQPGGRLQRLFAYRPPTLTVRYQSSAAAAPLELRLTLDTNPNEVASELGI